MRALKPLAPKRTLIRNSVSILACAALTACLCAPTRNSADKPQQAVSATRISGINSAFDLVQKKSSRTPRADLFRLVNALDKAYGLLNFSPPYPAIRIAGAGHSALGGSTIARAELSDEGDSYIYFDRRNLMGRSDLQAVVLHELAHLKAWRIHGTEIAAHGREFREICHQVTTSEKCTAKER